MKSGDKSNRPKTLRKLQQFRQRWAGHEGVDTVYGHILIGSQDNGAVRQRKKAAPRKRTPGGKAGA